MTDQTAPMAAGADAPQAQFTVEKIYVKDVSFEAPNAPQIFQEQGQPQLTMAGGGIGQAATATPASETRITRAVPFAAGASQAVRARAANRPRAKAPRASWKVRDMADTPGFGMDKAVSVPAIAAL